VALLIGLVVLLALAVGRLFSLRFERGDIYPRYSSLRADPLGTKALAEVIKELPGFSVERNYHELSRLKARQPATILYLGIDYSTRIDEEEFAEAERIARGGARLIISFAHELPLSSGSTSAPGTTPSPPKATPAPASTPVPATTPAPIPSVKSKRTANESVRFREAAGSWGVSFDRMHSKEFEAINAVAKPSAEETNLDSTVPWHTALYFKDLDPAWSTIYRCNDLPVAIERKFGAGTIVLCSDSYFLSNEGLLKTRASKLVARVIGPPQTVVFDELHNDVAENPNIAGIARKHGLGGAILALLGVAAFFIWKNAVPFLPRQASPEDGEAHVIGFDASAGFINLLRRGVPSNRILAVCVEEWLKSRGSRIRQEERMHVESVMRAHEGRSATKDAAAAYRTIAKGLNRH
jgi:hypothetical protein